MTTNGKWMWWMGWRTQMTPKNAADSASGSYKDSGQFFHPACQAEDRADGRLTESQNGRGWKGPLWVI